nr:MAG TPA: YopX protein [Caudoviricetes sp.]
MREILFRGKGNRYGRWVEGFYTPISTGHGMKDAIITGTDRNCSIPTLVVPETIGQYTGLTDKNGKKIFEGDIIKAHFRPQNFKNSPYAIGSVVFENGTFKVVVHVSKNSIEYKVFEKEDIIAYSIEHNFLGRGYVLEVIGNNHDNPELLKGEGE